MSRDLSARSPSSLRDGLYKLWRHFTRAYSTAGSRTGQVWRDGKPVYRKVVDFGALPNATSKAVAHGISTITRILDVRVVGNRYTEGDFVHGIWPPNSPTLLKVDATNVTIVAGEGVDLSATDDTHVIIDYLID